MSETQKNAVMAEPTLDGDTNSISDNDNNNSNSNNDASLLASWKLVMVIFSLCLGIFLFGLDVNILGTAIPQITSDFSSLRDVAWYGSAYLLTVTAFQPLFGNLYKFFNPKLVYLGSLVIFEGELPFLSTYHDSFSIRFSTLSYNLQVALCPLSMMESLG